MKRSVFFAILLSALPAVHASAVTHHIGRSGEAVAAILEDAVLEAASGDTILVYPGSYYTPSLNVLKKDLVIKSVEGPEKTILDGGGGVSLISTKRTTCATVIEGFTIVKGYAEQSGGAIILRGDATIRGNIFKNCSSKTGGAIYSTPNTSPVIEGNLFLDNKAITMGGAIYSQHGEATIRNNTFVGNTAGTGGDAIGVFGKRPTIENNLFVSNTGPSVIYIGYKECEPKIDCNAFWNNEGNILSFFWDAKQIEDTNRKSGDPKFTDTNLYRLSSNSPFGGNCSCGSIGW